MSRTALLSLVRNASALVEGVREVLCWHAFEEAEEPVSQVTLESICTHPHRPPGQSLYLREERGPANQRFSKNNMSHLQLSKMDYLRRWQSTQ